ncbi:MAG: hypothetical protein LBU43_12090 [Candidatus Accumulibacter sp.]|jgi:hypothetical protein|nr:hypothetical protein [Accumulibacter sp.]
MADVVCAFHDGEEIAPRMLSRIAKHPGVMPDDPRLSASSVKPASGIQNDFAPIAPNIVQWAAKYNERIEIDGGIYIFLW